MKSFFIGLQFLTRLKLVNQTEWDVTDFGRSVMYFPIVGAVIGAFMCLVYYLLQWTSLNVSVIAIILVAFEFLFTGGLHADGYMDTCDGLFSGRDRERKLEIMKDSRVGSNAVVGFVFLTLLKWQFLTMALPLSPYEALLFMPILSRYTLTLSIKCYPYARPEGMGKAFAVYSPSYTVAVATVLALLPLLSLHFSYAPYFIFVLLVNVILNKYITKHLGGTTGDTYGFVIEVTELLFILFFILTYQIFTMYQLY